MDRNAVGLRHYALGLLARQPMSGYDISRFLKSLGWLIGVPSFGAIYPALHDLHRKGWVTMELVTVADKPPRKVYSITEAGRRALQEWLALPIPESAPLKAFVIRLLASSCPELEPAACLQQRKDEIIRQYPMLSELAREPREATDLGMQLALDYGLALAKAELTWLNAALARTACRSSSGACTPGGDASTR